MQIFKLPPNITAIQKGRIVKALNHKYRFNGKVMTLGAYLVTQDIIGKHQSKTAIQCKDCKDMRLHWPCDTKWKIIYCARLPNNYQIQIPKIIFDILNVEEGKTILPF